MKKPPLEYPAFRITESSMGYNASLREILFFGWRAPTVPY